MIKTLKELQQYADDQAYWCHCPDTIKLYFLDGPFKCGNVCWRGGGLVSVEAYLVHPLECLTTNYARSIFVLLKHLVPIEGEKWYG